MKGSSTKTKCDRCGTCCTKGGPSLHCEDRDLLLREQISLEHLITIRKGEPVLSLFGKDPEPAKAELVKIKGKKNGWTCIFLVENGAECMIYEHRPHECSLLKCWDTADLEKVAGKNLLGRHDILPPHDPIVPLIKRHEEICALDDLSELLSAVTKQQYREKALKELTVLVDNDLAIRSEVYATFNFSLDLELFFFGRPIFTIVRQFGIRTHEINGRCSLSLLSPPAMTRFARS